MKGLMLSALSAKKNEVAEKIVCEPKSLEVWKKINRVSDEKKEKKKSSCIDVKEPEEKRVNNTVMKTKAKELKKEGIKLNKKEEKKKIKKLAHWDKLQEKLNGMKEVLKQFPKVYSGKISTYMGHHRTFDRF